MRKFVKSALIIALSAALASPTIAATNFSFSNLSGAEYDTAGVYVLGDYTFTGTDDDVGGYDQVQFELWDDSVLKFSQISSLLVNTTGTFHFSTWYPGLVGTSAQGVGLYFTDLPGGSVSTFIDPYDVPHYSDPSQCTHDCGPIGAIPEPETYAMMLAGLGLLGVVARRRKQKEATA